MAKVWKAKGIEKRNRGRQRKKLNQGIEKLWYKKVKTMKGAKELVKDRPKWSKFTNTYLIVSRGRGGCDKARDIKFVMSSTQTR